MDDTDPKIAEAAKLQAEGEAALKQDNPDAAKVCFDRAMELYEQCGEFIGMGNCYLGLGDWNMRMGRGEASKKAYERALEIFEPRESALGCANAYLGLGRVLADPIEAMERLYHALALHRQLGDTAGEMADLGSLSQRFIDLSDYKKSLKAAEQAMKIADELDDNLAKWIILGTQAEAFQSLGEGQAFQASMFLSDLISAEHDAPDSDDARARLADFERQVGSETFNHQKETADMIPKEAILRLTALLDFF
ncbi:MAG: tetratricopeptide repeat protein [Deltaproteobacteria bacterium]|nr:tetratricopeptide repeat protein [Deltaproteobacteria bacterium]MCB9489769.1 tetratricopeptide repeat protein [Deltaproteobacteria bacterium]